MSVKITRRRLAAVALGSPAVVRAVQAPATSPPPEDLNAAAREQLHKNSEALNKVELSMATEPSFQFKA